MFLLSFPNSTLNLFLVASVMPWLLVLDSYRSPSCWLKSGKGFEHVDIGDGGPSPRDKGSWMFKFSRPMSKLTVGLMYASWFGPDAVPIWLIPIVRLLFPSWTTLVGKACGLSSWGLLLELPISNLNLPLSTLWTSDSMRESGDSGICP